MHKSRRIGLNEKIMLIASTQHTASEFLLLFKQRFGGVPLVNDELVYYLFIRFGYKQEFFWQEYMTANFIFHLVLDSNAFNQELENKNLVI